MVDVLLRRSSTLAMHPADGLAEEEISQFPMGREILCTLKRTRSPKNLRHYFACLQALAKATGTPGGKDTLHELLKLELGLVTPIRLASGEIRMIPASIAMDKMLEPDFVKFKREAFDVLHANFGVDPATLNREGAQLLGRISL